MFPYRLFPFEIALQAVILRFGVPPKSFIYATGVFRPSAPLVAAPFDDCDIVQIG